MKNKKKAVAIIRKGRVISICSSTGNAGRCLGISDSTVRNYIKDGTKKGELSLRHATDKETELIRMLGGLPIYKEEEEAKEEQKEATGKKEKYPIVPYAAIGGRVCVTPCPYRYDTKPKVGSAQCMECPFFHGKNREEHYVFCSAVSGKTWQKTRERTEP